MNDLGGDRSCSELFNAAFGLNVGQSGLKAQQELYYCVALGNCISPQCAYYLSRARRQILWSRSWPSPVVCQLAVFVREICPGMYRESSDSNSNGLHVFYLPNYHLSHRDR